MKKLMFCLISKSSFGQSTILAELKVSTKFVAKEVCSCIFVTEQTREYCLDKYEVIFHRLRTNEIDQKNKSVRVAYLGFAFSAKAVYQNPESGCLLIQ